MIKKVALNVSIAGLIGAVVFPTIAFFVMGTAFGFDQVRIVNLLPASVIGGSTIAVVTYFICRSRTLFEQNVRVEFEKKLLEENSLAKSQFLSSIGHELRTPMNSIMGFGQLMGNGPETLSETQSEYLRQMMKSSEHLLVLIEQLLDFSNIEAGVLKLSLEEFSPEITVSDCVEMMRSQMTGSSISVEFQTPGTRLPPIVSDQYRFQQILLNLLSNAIKYNRPGGKVVVRSEIANSGFLKTSVADTGCGIPGNKYENVFEPFDRLGHEKGTIEGTGIGLTITKRLVELIGGKIGFDSEPDVGTTFWFELPLAQGGSETT